MYSKAKDMKNNGISMIIKIFTPNYHHENKLFTFSLPTFYYVFYNIYIHDDKLCLITEILNHISKILILATNFNIIN